MSLITGQDVTLSYGDHVVLGGVGFALERDDRVGLVGRNGEGKTTLLRIMAGELRPTSGTVQRRRGLRVGHLPQTPPAEGDKTLWQACLDVFAELAAMHERMEALAGQLADSAEAEDLKRFGVLQQAFETAGGYSYELRIRAVLTGLGFAPEQYGMPLGHLSGGQRARAMLARLLLEEPDVLLLDEPTNHLDIEALEWLERWLETLKSAVVVVSHDRYFLDKASRRTWEVTFSQLRAYRGNYSAYLQQVRHRQLEQTRIWRAQQEHISKTEEFIRRHHAGVRSKEARGRRTRLERFLRDEAIDRPRQHKDIRLRLSPAARSGDLVLKVQDLVVGYDPAEPLLRLAKMKVHRGQRVAIIGANGVGKTTLLRTVLGELQPLGGSARLGASVVTGYLSQTQEELDPEVTVLQAIRAAGGEEMKDGEARSLLGRFLFSDDEVFKRIADLSGGQRSRVVVAALCVRRPNVLVLDEPTNHLDLPSQEVFQAVLGEFEGTIFFVSHDRYLIDALATDIWAIEDRQVWPLRGRWEEYLAWRSQRRTEAGEAAEVAAGAPKGRAPAADREAQKAQARQAKRLQRRVERLEDEIHQLESRLQELSRDISQASLAERLDEVHRLGREYQQAEVQLKRAWEQWSDLAETLEG